MAWLAPCLCRAPPCPCWLPAPVGGVHWGLLLLLPGQLHCRRLTSQTPTSQLGLESTLPSPLPTILHRAPSWAPWTAWQRQVQVAGNCTDSRVNLCSVAPRCGPGCLPCPLSVLGAQRWQESRPQSGSLQTSWAWQTAVSRVEGRQGSARALLARTEPALFPGWAVAWHLLGTQSTAQWRNVAKPSGAQGKDAQVTAAIAGNMMRASVTGTGRGISGRPGRPSTRPRL